MKRASIFNRVAVGLVAGAAFASPLSARVRPTPHDTASKKLATGTVSDTLLSMMVTQCLDVEFRKLKTPCVVYVVGDAIQVNWLPEVGGVDAFVLSTSEASSGESHDGLKYFAFTEPERTRSGFKIGVGFGDACNSQGTIYAFRYSGKLLELKGPIGTFNHGCGPGIAERHESL